MLNLARFLIGAYLGIGFLSFIAPGIVVACIPIALAFLASVMLAPRQDALTWVESMWPDA